MCKILVTYIFHFLITMEGVLRLTFELKTEVRPGFRISLFSNKKQKKK